MKKFTTQTVGIAALLLLLTMGVYAQSENSSLSAFRNMVHIEQTLNVVPTVVEVPIDDIFVGYKQFAVLEEQTSRFISYFFSEKYKKKPDVISIYSDRMIEIGAHKLVDEDRSTSVDFLLPDKDVGTVELSLTSKMPVRSSSIVFDFARNVALPTNVEVRAVLDTGKEEIIVASKRMNGSTVSFPKTEAKKWRVKLTYAQLLRINEIRLVQDDVEDEVVRGLRFLAQPDMSYVVYLNPDRTVTLKTAEGGDLRDDDEVQILREVSLLENPFYQESDSDKDGVRDVVDNCVHTHNPEQTDMNGNGRGDVCEDFDRDGVINSTDNCPNEPNRSQFDEDSDGIGDVCDDEESRLTEKYKWIPWAGLGLAVLVLLIMFAIVAKRPIKKNVIDLESEEE